ncbi:rod shape-determining protein MreD [Oceanobacillus alkalisoli]|uniref:rod shape-determining protein MreD n=1 Tax=Oceanobacillus alkalisoli TaxID=2925113 RepID=UPI001EF0344B|nr:rod shape-determining protein MreD [Oceanobacillus alkalisoli]MCF3941889.1 rod shape-determining protein MreD [Oceanobacillus alkalisoli]MCG5104264.1 rod shape-determining protein MreD [Oceanobacillus alkalisoli]
MKKAYLPLILLVLVIVEGLAINLLPNEIVLSTNLIIAHWVLVFLVYIAVYYDVEDTYYSITYAFIFGLLIDVVYTGILGIYMFSYGIAIYAIHGLQKLLHRNFYVLLILGVTAIAVADGLIYMMYTVIGVTDMIWSDYLLRRMLPTILANLLFLLLLFPLFKKRIVQWSKEQLDRGN